MSGTLKIAQVDGQSHDLTFKTVGGTGLYKYNNESTTTAEIRLYKDSGVPNQFVGLKASADIAATGLTFTLPAADGAANSVLITNGSKVLSFASVANLPGVVTTSTGVNWVNDNRLTKTISGTSQIEETQWIVDDGADGDLHSSGLGNIILDDNNTTGAVGPKVYFGQKDGTGALTWRIGVGDGTAQGGTLNNFIIQRSTGANTWTSIAEFA